MQSARRRDSVAAAPPIALRQALLTDAAHLREMAARLRRLADQYEAQAAQEEALASRYQ